MKKRLSHAFCLFCLLAVAACGQSEDAATIYVLTPPSKASLLTKDLGAISERQGLIPNLGQSIHSGGQTYWVIDARGRWVKLWGMNVPLSGHEDPSLCGKYSHGHPDPGQYIVMIDHVVPLVARETPRELIAEVGRELSAMGYRVQARPVLCSPLSKAQSGG